jgi:putative ABC transport system permease protein
VLGVATLYAISSITLLSRQYEFVVLRVMGYDQGDVLVAYVKELLLQCLLAIPLGLLAGYFLLGQLVTVFTLDSMSFSRYMTPASYLYAVAITLAVLGIMVLVARHQLTHQDLVEGLKSHSE